MTTEREELALRFLHQDFPYYSPVPTSMDDPRIDPEHKEYAYVSVEIVEAAGYRKPRVIRTVEELKTVPNGSILMSGARVPVYSGAIWRMKSGGMLELVGRELEGVHPATFFIDPLPATVLHEGAPNE